MAPVFKLEPRFYYNLGNRLDLEKNISRNSGNFISVSTSYEPDWFAILNKDLNIVSTISIIPTWGIRRQFGTSRFNYEVGAGFGYRYAFYKAEGYSENEGEAVLSTHLRIGYTF